MDTLSFTENPGFQGPRGYALPSPSFLDLEDLNEADFFNNVHLSENLEDFSNELFNSFFDDPALAERNPLLDMDLDPQTPDIQAEHSYSLCGDSAPQSPLLSVKTEEDDDDLESGAWALEHELRTILVKQEQNLHPESVEPQAAVNSMPPQAEYNPMHRHQPLPDPSASLIRLSQGQRCPPSPTPTPYNVSGGIWHSPPQAPVEMTQTIKDEPREETQFLSTPSDEMVQLPPTPPSSHSSDSDGSQSPRSQPPSSPARPVARSSNAISSSPLLTAPHKLQGTSGPLMLTEEEKRTLIAEGYPIPIKLPLSKAEEKALKRVRRKIKNKISAQESRRKKKEYVECLEKKVESYTSENSDLWKKVETLENANRTLLQQLQKLQALVSGKISRPYKLASTQTGTCLMVVVVCFVLVLGSLLPCFPEFSSVSQTVKTVPGVMPDVYTTSRVRSRSLLFYDEAGSVEDSYSSFLMAGAAESWDPDDAPTEERKDLDPSYGHLAQSHEDTRYLSKSQVEVPDLNQTDTDIPHRKERYRKRDSESGEAGGLL
ncbi:cyclic AMP-responsive element-binding protein 3-like protein 1 [Ambystoma mexicanum]|uniref:cyclic AMP-responsive element-binding protein 3-like protein 1 n=1 Tax=Ambystoma mexicanum TaxID=8296 RepID=UPI0037E8C925